MELINILMKQEYFYMLRHGLKYRLLARIIELRLHRDKEFRKLIEKI